MASAALELLRTSIAVAQRINPITPHHHVVWCVLSAKNKDGLPELSAEDRLSFFHAVRDTQEKITTETGITDFNINWEEGCGKPVPGGLDSWTRYVHVVPRMVGDLEGDAVHELLDRWTWSGGMIVQPEAEPWPCDAKRKDRTPEIMAAEAAQFRQMLSSAGIPKNMAACADGFKFSHIPIASGLTFFVSEFGSTVAFVNLRPFRRGHVLLSPRRCVARLRDLTRVEYEDLIDSAGRLGDALRLVEFPRGFEFSVQDGPLASQSIPHVHIHMIPRI
ncbi:Bifunctional bis(5'-adenosyl)-triphosphatase/adenylylsulfatase FHIT [Porphyridium purpureum]|uniref:Bifunctional bis(5'-adenosyl)-triphosphatase/adenylylsulfatase FHIT n=1 Tax=Porphyridium purpureum TaxID=35688 RepID=A0A5J4Z907_PORPP|nr:Bifunctional bis(5'-adenosyl)-triphosphatase/adenylylsulfatase FHIT [Porphyridium purpureum]|eukprot:POR6305..scf295_1